MIENFDFMAIIERQPSTWKFEMPRGRVNLPRGSLKHHVDLGDDSNNLLLNEGEPPCQLFSQAQFARGHAAVGIVPMVGTFTEIHSLSLVAHKDLLSMNR